MFASERDIDSLMYLLWLCNLLINSLRLRLSLLILNMVRGDDVTSEREIDDENTLTISINLLNDSDVCTVSFIDLIIPPTLDTDSLNLNISFIVLNIALALPSNSATDSLSFNILYITLGLRSDSLSDNVSLIERNMPPSLLTFSVS